MNEKDIQEWGDTLLSLEEKGLIKFVELPDGSLGVQLNGKAKVIPE